MIMISVMCVEAKLLELIHIDLANFENTEIRSGKRYYVTFIDDYSENAKVYLIRSKDETKGMFLKYKAQVKNWLDHKIKRLRYDISGEYGTSFLKDFSDSHGIVHVISALYTPQQNEVTERKK